MKKNIPLLIVLLIHLIILNLIQFTAWPEMVSFPYFINHGLSLYKDVVHAYPPLLVEILAILYKIFGYNVQVLKIFGWTILIANDLLLFLIIKKLTKKENLALLSIVIYIFIQPILEGNMVWPDIAIIPFILLSLLLLINKKYFLGGISLGLALLTKQTGILFIIFTGIYLLLIERKLNNLIKFGIGSLVAIIPFFLILISQNLLKDFWLWAVYYPSKYWTNFPGYVQLSPTIRENINLLLLFAPLAYLVFTAKQKLFTDNKFLLIFGSFLCTVISIYPRFSFFHFQSALAVLIIVFAYLFSKTKLNYNLIIVIPILVLVVNLKSLQFGGTRFWDKNDSTLAQTIKNDSPKNKPVYLLGLNSNLYALADKLPNKPWLDNFGWYLEIPGIQEEVIKSFEKEMPSTIFWASPQNGNWFDIGTYQPKNITNWIERNYTKEKEIQKGIWEWKPKSQK